MSIPLRDLDGLSPSRLFAQLDPALRLLAARALYAHDWQDRPTRREADLAVAQALRSREVAIRKLPTDRRAEYLARAVRPSDSLAVSLLMALHLEQRRGLLAAFLDALEIPHKDGIIEEGHDLRAPSASRLESAAHALFRSHPGEEVEIYLATLLAMDREVWGGLAAVLAARRLDGPGTRS